MPSPRSAKPRLLLIITELHMGGAARVMRDHASAFAPHYDIHEVVFRSSDANDFPGERPPIVLDGGKTSGGALANLVRRARRLARIKRSLGTEISISHLEGAHYLDLLSRGAGKVVLCVHGSIRHNRDFRGAKGWLRRRVMMPALYRRADRIVTVSRDIVPELVAMGVDHSRMLTINNFFDVDGIAAKAGEPMSAEELAIFASRPVLVTAARFAEQKNLTALIDVFAALKQSRQATLVVLGDGPLRDTLVGQAAGRGLSIYRRWTGEPLTPGRDVYFLGNRANPFPFLAKATLFVLPSSWEGFPMALCEAMACGTAVVSTDCPTGPREILAPASARPPSPIRESETGEYGVLMPTLDRTASFAADRQVWVEALVRLLDDPAERERLAIAGRRRIEDFTPEKIVPQWLSLIDALLAEPAATSR